MIQEHLLEELRRDLKRRDIERWLGIYGKKRTGKSTLAYWNATVVWDDFDVDHHIAWTADDYVDICLELPKGGAAILDEPIAGLLSFDANTGQNKSLYRAATILGDRNVFHQVICPSRKRFGRAFQEDYLELANHVVQRGIARLEKIADNDTQEVFHVPQHLDEFDFPDFPPNDKARYLRRKREFQDEHRNVDAYNERRQLEHEMEERARSILLRHGVIQPIEVDVSN